MASVNDYVKCETCGANTDTPVNVPHYGRFFCDSCWKKSGDHCFQGWGEAPEAGTPWECSCAEKHSGVYAKEAN